MSQIAIYMGWYAEHACGPFAQPTVEFMPGAFAYHLHSFSASTIRSTTLRWVGPFLAKGATATMGCVEEPYLAGTPDMTVFAARFLYQGFSFGEAACACQSVLSWQTTVVGDPLYRPVAKNPEVQQQEVVKQKSKLAQWSWLRIINMNLANGKNPAELVALLEQLPARKQSSILSEKLGDLYAEQGKPSSSIHAYEEALNLDPSREQRIHLTLELGEKLRALNKEEEAYDYYQALLKNCPDYPDKRDIIQRLIPLAQKMNKSADVQKYEAELKSLSAAGK
jgi:tetratricopeptide (TPR) repeat protein